MINLGKTLSDIFLALKRVFIQEKSRSKIVLVLTIGAVFLMALWFQGKVQERTVLKQIYANFEVETRQGEILITGSILDEERDVIKTTIKFSEMRSVGNPVEGRYLSFAGPQFTLETLVVPLEKIFPKKKRLRNKKIFLFSNLLIDQKDFKQTIPLTDIGRVPPAYQISDSPNKVEVRFWEDFWKSFESLDLEKEKWLCRTQIESGQTVFSPGIRYLITLFSDGEVDVKAHYPDYLTSSQPSAVSLQRTPDTKRLKQENSTEAIDHRPLESDLRPETTDGIARSTIRGSQSTD